MAPTDIRTLTRFKLVGLATIRDGMREARKVDDTVRTAAVLLTSRVLGTFAHAAGCLACTAGIHVPTSVCDATWVSG